MKYNYICTVCGKEFSHKEKIENREDQICKGCKIRTFYKEHPEKELERKLKREQTNLKKFGCVNPSLNKDIQKKISSKLEALNKDPKKKVQIITKRKNSNLQRFGVEFPAQRDDILQKGLEVQRSRNNGKIGWEDSNKQRVSEQGAHSKEANAKRIESNLKRFSTEYASQNEAIKAKVKQTYIEHTGYDHPQHNPEVIHSNKGYLFEETHFDSSWELAYFIWLRDNKKAFIYHPPYYMDYIDDEGTSRKYQPDFLVEGTFYEIKGDQFFNEKGEPYNSYTKKFWWGKYKALEEHNVKLIKLDESKKYLKYVKDNYGKNFIKQFRTSKLK